MIFATIRSAATPQLLYVSQSDEQQNTVKASQLLLDSHITPHLVEISSDVFPLLYGLSKADTHSTVTHHFLVLLLGNWLNSSSTEIINLRRTNGNISRW